MMRCVTKYWRQQQFLDYAMTLGLRPSEIAHHLGIHRSHVARWMNGSRPVPARYWVQLSELIIATIPRYMTAFQAQGKDPATVEEERARICTQFQELYVETKCRTVFTHAANALTLLKKMPEDALSVRLALPVIAWCATAILQYTNLVAACGRGSDFIKEVKPNADRDRQPSEPGDDGQPSAVNQQTDAALLALH